MPSLYPTPLTSPSWGDTVSLCLIRCTPTPWDTVTSPWTCQAVTAWRSVHWILFVTIATFRLFQSHLQGLVLYRPPATPPRGTVAKIPLPQALVTTSCFIFICSEFYYNISHIYLLINFQSLLPLSWRVGYCLVLYPLCLEQWLA